MKHPDVARLMAELYFTEPAAQSVLLQIGFPPQMLPPFPANSFWSNAIILLEQGLVEGEDSIGDLIDAAASTFPGNRGVQALRARWSEMSPERANESGHFVPEQSEATRIRSAFVSYSQIDERYRQRLDISLVQLRRNNLISIWHDRKIIPGQDWDREIDKRIENADIVLLLVSPDFLASDYAYSNEMLRALERHESGSTTVVPVILRPCDWQNSPLRSLQVLPSKGRPVSSWKNRDQAWLDVVQGLRRVILGQGLQSQPRVLQLGVI